MVKRKIGVVVTQVATSPGFEQVVSGHVQLPINTIYILQTLGHEVDLLTTEFPPGFSLPANFPPRTKIHQMPAGYRSRSGLPKPLRARAGFHPYQFFEQLKALKQITKAEGYEILHFFGGYKIAYLASILDFLGVKSPKVVTLSMDPFPDPFWPISRILWKRIPCLLTTTDYMAQKLHRKMLVAEQIRHGVVRHHKADSQGWALDPPHRVVFWRDPSFVNGADIALEVFKTLAPKFPHISFDLAFRPFGNPVSGIKNIKKTHSNIHIHQFPYQNGISISRLLLESICVLLPFRKLSVNPQFSILESMQAGCAVITTSIDSNEELIQTGKNGFLLPPDNVEEAVKIVERLLRNPHEAMTIGSHAEKDVESSWNWDIYADNLSRHYEILVSGGEA